MGVKPILENHAGMGYCKYLFLIFIRFASAHKNRTVTSNELSTPLALGFHLFLPFREDGKRVTQHL